MWRPIRAVYGFRIRGAKVQRSAILPFGSACIRLAHCRTSLYGQWRRAGRVGHVPAIVPLRCASQTVGSVIPDLKHVHWRNLGGSDRHFPVPGCTAPDVRTLKAGEEPRRLLREANHRRHDRSEIRFGLANGGARTRKWVEGPFEHSGDSGFKPSPRPDARGGAGEFRPRANDK